MTEQTITGQIVECEDTGAILIDYECLIDKLEFDSLEGKKVIVRYYISDTELTSMEDAEGRWVLHACGVDSADSEVLCGSEWTGLYGWDQELVLGGHDLMCELQSHVGKWIAFGVREAE